MTSNNKCPIGIVLWDIDALTPILVGWREAPIIGFFPDGIGEDEAYPVESELGDDLSGTAALQGLTIEAAGNRILDSPGTLAVFLVAFPP